MIMGLFGKKQKVYRLHHFDTKDVQKLKKDIADQIKGLVMETADEKADQIIDQMYSTPFTEDDTMNLSFDVSLGGGYVLGVLGKIKLKRKK